MRVRVGKLFILVSSFIEIQKLDHTKHGCRESLIQGKIHGEQNLNDIRPILLL